MRIISYLLTFILLSNSLPLWADNSKKTDDLIVKLDLLSKNFQKNCLPGNTKNIELHLKQYGLSEVCWQMITEINHLESQLSLLHPELQDKVNCSSGSCANYSAPLVNLPNLPLTTGTACSSAVVKQNLADCPGDLACSLLSTTTTIPYTNIQLIKAADVFPKGLNPDRCTSNDSCTTQIATAFVSSITKFFTGTWDLLVSAGGYAKDKVGDFWKWVTSAEDTSSAAQLALAQASEDEGLFQMLRKDFTGTLFKIWQGLIGGIKNWLKADIFCQRWEGTPHRSKCLKPTDAFECVSCKSMVNGICAIGGVFVSEILPSFITGGLTTAAKHGANAAAHFLKHTFKISDKAITTIKTSKALKSSLGIASKIDQAAKVGTILAKINQYFISPARKVAKVSFMLLSGMIRNSKAYMAQTSTGKYIVFAQDGLKMAGKVALYPIENNMTILSFKLGQRTFDKAFKLAAPSLANKTSVALAVTSHTPALDGILTRIEIGHLRKTNTLELEREQIRILQGKRPALAARAFQTKNPSFSEIIRTVYPELNYSDLARSLKPGQILAQEKDLYLQISKIKSPELQKSMMHKYQKLIVESKQRKALLKDRPNYKEIIDNTNLSPITRGARGIQITGKLITNAQHRKKLEEGIRNAMNFSWGKKESVLVGAGFTASEAQKLMRYGIVGMPP